MSVPQNSCSNDNASVSAVVSGQNVGFGGARMNCEDCNISLRRFYYTVEGFHIETVTCDICSKLSGALVSKPAVHTVGFVGDSEAPSTSGELSWKTENHSSDTGRPSSLENSNCGQCFEKNGVNVLSGKSSDNCTKGENSTQVVCETEILSAFEGPSTMVDDDDDGSSRPELACEELNSNAETSAMKCTEGDENEMAGNPSVILEQNVDTLSVDNNSTASMVSSFPDTGHGTSGNCDFSNQANSNEVICVEGGNLPADECEKLTHIADTSEHACWLEGKDLNNAELGGEGVLPDTCDKSKDINMTMSGDELDGAQPQLASDSDFDFHFGISDDDSDSEEFPSFFSNETTDTPKENSKSIQEGLDELKNFCISSSKWLSSIADAVNYTTIRKKEKAAYHNVVSKVSQLVFHDEKIVPSEINDIQEECDWVTPNRLNDPPPGLKIIVEKNMFCHFNQKDVAHQINNSNNNMVSQHETLLMRDPVIASKILPTAVAYLRPSCIKNHDAFLTYLFRMAAVSSDFITINSCERTIKRFVCSENSESVRWCPSVDDLYTVFLNYGIDINAHCPMKQVLERVKENIHPKKSEGGTEKCVQCPDWAFVGLNFNAILEILTSVLICCCTYSSTELSNIIVLLSWLSLDVRLLLTSVQISIQKCVAVALVQIPEKNWPTEMEFLAKELCKLGQHHKNIGKIIEELPSFVPHGLSLQRASAFMALKNFLGVNEIDTSMEIDCIINFLKVMIVHLGNKELEDLCLFDTIISLINLCVNPLLDEIPVEKFNILCSLVMKMSVKVKDDCNFPEKHMVREHLVRIRCNWIFHYPTLAVLDNEDSKESTWDSDEDSDTSSELYSHGTSNGSVNSDEEFTEEFCVLCTHVEETQCLRMNEQLPSSEETFPSEPSQVKPKHPDDCQSCDVFSNDLKSGNVKHFSVNSSSVRTECSRSVFSDIEKTVHLPSSDEDHMEVCEANGNNKVIGDITKTAESDLCDSQKALVSSNTGDAYLENTKSPLVSPEGVKSLDFTDVINSFSEQSNSSSSVSENFDTVIAPDILISPDTIEKVSVFESRNSQNSCDVKGNCFKMTECQLTTDEEGDGGSKSRIVTESIMPTSAIGVTMNFSGTKAPVNTSGSINELQQFACCGKQNILAGNTDNAKNCFAKMPNSIVQFSGLEHTQNETTESARTSESFDDSSRKDKSEPLGGKISAATCDEHVRTKLFLSPVSNPSSHSYTSSALHDFAETEVSGMESKSSLPNTIVPILQNEISMYYTPHSDTVKTESNISCVSTQVVSVAGDAQSTVADDSCVVPKCGSTESNKSPLPLQIKTCSISGPPHKSLENKSCSSVAFLDCVLTYNTDDPEHIPFTRGHVTKQSSETSNPVPGNYDVFRPQHHSHFSHEVLHNIPFLEVKAGSSLVQETEEATIKLFESINRDTLSKNIFNKSAWIPFISDNNQTGTTTISEGMKTVTPQNHVDAVNDSSIPCILAESVNNDTNIQNYYNSTSAPEGLAQHNTFQFCGKIPGVFPFQYCSENPSFPVENGVVEVNPLCVPYVSLQEDLCSSNSFVYGEASPPATTSNMNTEPRIPFILENVNPAASVISHDQKTCASTPPPLGLFHKNNRIPFIEDETDVDFTTSDVEKHNVTASVKLCENVHSDSILSVKTSDVVPAIRSPSSSTQNSSDCCSPHASPSVLSMCTLVGNKPSTYQEIVKGTVLSNRDNIKIDSSSASTRLDKCKIPLLNSEPTCSVTNAASCAEAGKDCENASTSFVNSCTLTASETQETETQSNFNTEDSNCISTVGKPSVLQESETHSNIKGKDSKTVFLEQQKIIANGTVIKDVVICDSDSEDCVIIHEVITVPG